MSKRAFPKHIVLEKGNDLEGRMFCMGFVNILRSILGDGCEFPTPEDNFVFCEDGSGNCLGLAFTNKGVIFVDDSIPVDLLQSEVPDMDDVFNPRDEVDRKRLIIDSLTDFNKVKDLYDSLKS